MVGLTSRVDWHNEDQVNHGDNRTQPGSIPQIDEVECVVSPIDLLYLVVFQVPDHLDPVVEWFQVKDARIPRCVHFLGDVCLL